MIGKTRQTQPAEVEELFDPEVGQARGMLRRTLAAGKMRHSRRRPASDLAPWIAHYWIIRWDLRGCPPHIAESLPHPNVHLIFENESAVIAGVQINKFHRVLEGQGHVFGAPRPIKGSLLDETAPPPDRETPTPSIPRASSSLRR